MYPVSFVKWMIQKNNKIVARRWTCSVAHFNKYSELNLCWYRCGTELCPRYTRCMWTDVSSLSLWIPTGFLQYLYVIAIEQLSAFMDFPAHLILTCSHPELSAEASVCDYSGINTTLIVFRIAGFILTCAVHVRVYRDVADSCHVAFRQRFAYVDRCCSFTCLTYERAVNQLSYAGFVLTVAFHAADTYRFHRAVIELAHQKFSFGYLKAHRAIPARI